MTVHLEEGALYKVRIDLGEGIRVRTVIRRRFRDGRPSLYYVEDDVEEEYGDGLRVNPADVRVIEIRKGKVSTTCLRARDSVPSTRSGVPP